MVYLDEREIGIGVSELPVGTYSLRIRAFGYTEYRAGVRVSDGRTTMVTVDLREAPFSFSDLQFARPRFNPRNPGSST